MRVIRPGMQRFAQPVLSQQQERQTTNMSARAVDELEYPAETQIREMEVIIGNKTLDQPVEGLYTITNPEKSEVITGNKR